MKTANQATKTVVPVFFSCDNNYLPFLSVALRSMIDNLNPATVCRVYVLNDGLNREGVARLNAMQTENVTIEFVDVRPQIAPILEKLNLRDYYTPSIYYRLFIPTLFPQYSKALYLDADIAVTGDITKLYNTPNVWLPPFRTPSSKATKTSASMPRAGWASPTASISTRACWS